MGILRKLRQWREKSDGTLEGPALSTESLAIGDDGPATSFGDFGGLYLSDPNDAYQFGEQTQVDVSIPSDVDRAFFYVKFIQEDDANRLKCRLNDEDNDSYAWHQNTGDNDSGDDSIELCRRLSGSRAFHGFLSLSHKRNVGRAAIFGNGLMPPLFPDDGVLDWGRNNDIEEINELNFFADDGTEEIAGEIEVWY